MMTIIFDSNGDYTVTLEGEPWKIEEAIKMVNINDPVGKLLKTILDGARKKVRQSNATY